MRYVVLVLLGVFSAILNGSLVTGMSIAGIPVDLVLLMVAALSLMEKTAMPVIFAAAAGLLMDIMYSPALGVYAISYTVVAIALYIAFRRVERYNPLMIFAAGAGGYLLKELVMGILVYAMGSRFSFGSMLARYVLPGMLLAGGLVFISYGIMALLYRNHWMRPRPAYKNNDF